jgi:hypothetical protein
LAEIVEADVAGLPPAKGEPAHRADWPRSSHPERHHGAQAVALVVQALGERPGTMSDGYRESADSWAGLLLTAPAEACALPSSPELVESAQACWRAVNAPHLVALFRAGARFEGGHLVERSKTLAV